MFSLATTVVKKKKEKKKDKFKSRISKTCLKQALLNYILSNDQIQYMFSQKEVYSVSQELFSIANNSTHMLHLIFVKSQVLIIQIISHPDFKTPRY